MSLTCFLFFSFFFSSFWIRKENDHYLCSPVPMWAGWGLCVWGDELPLPCHDERTYIMLDRQSKSTWDFSNTTNRKDGVWVDPSDGCQRSKLISVRYILHCPHAVRRGRRSVASMCMRVTLPLCWCSTASRSAALHTFTPAHSSDSSVYWVTCFRDYSISPSPFLSCEDHIFERNL